VFYFCCFFLLHENWNRKFSKSTPSVYATICNHRLPKSVFSSSEKLWFSVFDFFSCCIPNCQTQILSNVEELWKILSCCGEQSYPILQKPELFLQVVNFDLLSWYKMHFWQKEILVKKSSINITLLWIRNFSDKKIL